MTDTPAGAPSARVQLPFYVWPLALLVGVLVAAGSLGYAPGGRLNVLWLWLLWAGLPLLGSLVSVAFLLWGRDRPWLFRWRHQRLHWYPNRTQRWHMLWLLQAFWLWLGAGILLGFLVLLLFTDLAFGWSSTLLSGEHTLLSILETSARPWENLWPAAVPDSGLMEATRYRRIDPEATATERAGDWWPFLMASLLCYNLLPRALLAGLSYGRWWRLARAARAPSVTAPPMTPVRAGTETPLKEMPLNAWEAAVTADWELESQPSGPQFGRASWEEDKRALDELLAGKPERLLWRVSANRSPVGEMADLIERARQNDVAEQGLLALTDRQTRTDRHLASWRRFAQQQQLTWVTP